MSVQKELYSFSAFERGSASSGQSGGVDEGPPCVFSTAVLTALLHGATAAFLLLWGGGRTVERAVGTMVLPGTDSIQYLPVLVGTCVKGTRGSVQPYDGRWRSVCCRSRWCTGSFRLSGTGWNVRLMMAFASLKELRCCDCCCCRSLYV